MFSACHCEKGSDRPTACALMPMDVRRSHAKQLLERLSRLADLLDAQEIVGLEAARGILSRASPIARDLGESASSQTGAA